MLWNGSCRFLKQTNAASACMPGKLADPLEWKAFHSMAFDGLRLRKSRSFLTGRPWNVVPKKMAQQCSPESTVDLHSRSMNWVRDFRLDGSRQFPSKMFPQAGLNGDFSHAPNQRTIFQASNTAVLRPPQVGRTKPRVIC